MTWRRLGNLIRHLPPESATGTALRNDDRVDLTGGDPAAGRWSQAEMLQAATVDAVRSLEWTLVAVNTPKKAQRPEKPEPIPRPGAQQDRKRKTLTDEQYERLYAHINGLPGGPQLTLVKGGRNRGG